MACQRLRDALVAVWGEVSHDPMVQPQVERGAPGWVLVSVASRPGDVLMLGAGQHGALARLVSRRVSHYCLAHAHCPVPIVPPDALAREIGHGRLARAWWRRTLTPRPGSRRSLRARLVAVSLADQVGRAFGTGEAVRSALMNRPDGTGTLPAAHDPSCPGGSVATSLSSRGACPRGGDLPV
jgi:Universal stress protein family